MDSVELSTEASTSVSEHTNGTVAPPKKRGRPKGSKNAPKGEKKERKARAVKPKEPKAPKVAKRRGRPPKPKAEAADAKKKRKPMGQNGSPMDLTADKVNEKERAVVSILLSSPSPLPLNAIAAQSFPSEDAKKANSWTRNSLRRLIRGSWVEKVSKGTYAVAAANRSRAESLS